MHHKSYTNSTIIIQSADITSNRVIRESHFGKVAFEDKQWKLKPWEQMKLSKVRRQKEYRNSHA